MTITVDDRELKSGIVDLPVARGGYRPKRMRRRQLHILQGLPGIGPIRAMRLLKYFRSLRCVFRAKPEQWMKVDGVGKAGAGRIADLLDAEFDEKWIENGHNSGYFG